MSKVFIPPEYFLRYISEIPINITFLTAIIDGEYIEVAIDQDLHPNPYKVLNKKNFITLMFDEVCIYEDRSENEFYRPEDTDYRPIKAFRYATINTNRISEIIEYPDNHPFNVYVINSNIYKKIRRQYGQHL